MHAKYLQVSVLIGIISSGKRADLVLLNRKLFDIDPYEISDKYVTMTIFDGRTLYQRTE
jgi:predicted amidohydrolase YtcJ